MRGPLAPRLAIVGLAAAAILTAQPRLNIALERAGDLQPRRFALSGEVMGRALGLVISWSGSGQQLIR